MIEVSLSLIELDVIKISPKIRLHWDMRQTVGLASSKAIARDNQNEINQYESPNLQKKMKHTVPSKTS